MAGIALAEELERLLDEDPVVADTLARGLFDKAMETVPTGRVVLYGAGGLAKSIRQSMIEAGFEITAWTDRDSSMWGRMVDGMTIIPPEEAIRLYSGSALWVISIFNCRHNLASTLAWLRGRGVGHLLPVQSWMWRQSEAFLPYFYFDLPSSVLNSGDRIRKAWALLSDEVSRIYFLSGLRWRLTLDAEALPDPDGEVQYFPSDILPLKVEEVFVDCGAFNGDVLRYMKGRGAFPAQAIAFEPDPNNFTALEAWASSLPNDLRCRLKVFKLGLGGAEGEVAFMASGNEASAVSPSGNIKVPVVILDAVLSKIEPTLIKMDIEGMEMEALKGASKVLSRAQPKLAICVYHRPEHLWEMPILVHDMAPGYQIFLRVHNYDGFDWVCYGLPSN